MKKTLIIIIAVLLAVIGFLAVKKQPVIIQETHTDRYIDSLISVSKVIQAREERMREDQRQRDSVRIAESNARIKQLERRIAAIPREIEKISSDSLAGIVDRMIPIENDTVLNINVSQGRVLVSSYMQIEPLQAVILAQRTRIIQDSVASVFRDQSSHRQIQALEVEIQAKDIRNAGTEQENAVLRKELRRQKVKTVLISIGGSLLILLVAL